MKYAIIGLGNPGEKYAGTRHNIGFDFLDYLADGWRAPDFSDNTKFDAQVSEVVIGGDKISLIKPQTFMNNSGITVRKLADYFSIDRENILVVYDDVDLPLGTVQFATGRGSGGHRGVQSVINELGTKDFARLRIGITPANEDGVADKQAVSVPEKGINPFVMGQFQSEEREQISGRFADMAKALKLWISRDVEAAMNTIH